MDNHHNENQSGNHHAARPLVSIVDAHKYFGDFHALRGVSLDVHAGEVVCIIGASGSGKTTLLRCVNQLVSLDRGAIWLAGELVGYQQQGQMLKRLSEKQIARQRLITGMVFQRFNLFAHMTALENIMEGPVPSAWPTKLIPTLHSYPAASSSASPSPGHSPWPRASCCLTSQPARWTRNWSAKCSPS